MSDTPRVDQQPITHPHPGSNSSLDLSSATGEDWLRLSWLDRSEYSPASKRPPAERPAIPGYEIMREIGQGGLSVVYLARDLQLKRRIAIKLMFEGVIEASAAEPFRQAAEQMMQLRHPGIAHVQATGEFQGRHFVVVEYVAGPDLHRFLDGRPLPARMAAALLEPIASAVQFAHDKGLVHGNLKPKNILLSPADDVDEDSELPNQRSELWVPKLTDFGMAKLRTSVGDSAHAADMAGTPNYLAPEQTDSPCLAGPEADLYSLGAIFYEMLTGCPPVNAADPAEAIGQIRSREPVAPRQLQPSIPLELESICLKCLQKAPRQRYASAGELADDLRRFLEGRSIKVHPANPIIRAFLWVRRKPVMALLMAAATVSVLGLIVDTAMLTFKNRHERLLRQQAEANRDLALAAADELVEELGRNSRLHRADLDDLRRSLMTRAIPHYLEFVRLTEGESAQDAQRAHALAMLGFIRLELGEWKQSVDDYTAACEVYESLLARFPNQREHERDFAVALSRRAHGFLNLARLADARSDLRSSAKLFEDLANSPAATPDDLINLNDCKSQLEHLK